MDSEVALAVNGIGKFYRIWNDPRKRFWGLLFGWMGFAKYSSRRRIGEQEGRCRYYIDYDAIRNISFEVKKGEIIGIVGRNGSGKSTLLQIICGTVSPSSGTKFTNGRIAALLELGSSFNPEFTGLENVNLNAAILGLSRLEIAERIEEIISFADIGDFLNQPLKTYSSGMMMRLAFSVQVALKPDILIIDEVLGVGDELFQRKCASRLQDLRKSGTTIIIVSHDANTIINTCDRAILLEQGELAKIGSPKDVIREYHRILYSSKRNTFEFLENRDHEIKNQTDEKKHDEDENIKLTIEKQKEDISYFDHSFLTKSKIIYPDIGAKIENIKIRNAQNEEVNHLCYGCIYRVEVEAVFSEDSYGVFFGSLISSLSGIDLSGTNWPNPSAPCEMVPAGKTAYWQYRFECKLLEGSYAVEIGIGGVLEGDPKAFLHRIVDAVVFKVLPNNNSCRSGIVSLEQESMLRFR